MLENKVIGFALTGSFCTLAAAIDQMELLSKTGCKIIPIVSESVASTDTPFGKAADFIERIEKICACKVVKTIVDAEPVGPKKLLDLLVVMPCTGNTMAKLYNGITDTPVTMACKAHLRNGRPLLIAPATNDGMSMNARNIGGLLNIKNDCYRKPTSLIANQDLLIPAIEKALSGECLQPQLI